MISFREAILREDFVVTAELPLHVDSTAAGIRNYVQTLSPVVDALQIGEDGRAVGHMSALAAASIVQSCDVDAVVRLSCRDRNRIALQSEILGAAALGVDSLILLRGEKLDGTSPIRARGIFEFSSTRLLQLARRLGEESGVTAGQGLFPGSCVTAFRPAADWQATRIWQKLDAGARFLQTQPCLNTSVVRAYMEKLVELKVPHRASVLVDVPLLTSAGDARDLKGLHKGAPVPDALVNRIVAADDPVAEGIAVSASVMRELRDVPGVSGINLRYSGDPRNAVAVIEQARS